MSFRRKSIGRSVQRVESTSDSCSFHNFCEDEIKMLRESLLSWYDKNKRDLPWRKPSTENLNQRAYEVWVSEIMLQQTQVATVIDYYNKWIKKWPTLQALADSNIEEINEAWSGLGYYSRGRRLFEGAQKIVKEMSCQIPTTALDLEKKLPGVGRYTAAAVASIAFGQVTGLVDGNVIRVLSRLRLIGANVNQQEVIEKIWSLSNGIVDPNRPGDFNQSLMELGAVICSPKTPSCGQCPVKKFCKAYEAVEYDRNRLAAKHYAKVKDYHIPDIESLVPGCNLCLPSDQWDKELGVQNFPRKPKKTAAKQLDLNVLIVSTTNSDDKQKFLICQRPKKGLLAGLWEFPSNECGDSAKEVVTQFCVKYGLQEDILDTKQFIGEVTHMFSHVHHHYKVWSVCVSSEKDLNSLDVVQEPIRWLSEPELNEAAISTGMRKVFNIFKNHQSSSQNSKQRKRKSSGEVFPNSAKKTQPTISEFFKRK